MEDTKARKHCLCPSRSPVSERGKLTSKKTFLMEIKTLLTETRRLKVKFFGEEGNLGVWISSSGKGPGLELQIQEFCQMLFLPTKSTLHPFPTAFCSRSLTCADAHGSWYPQATLGPVSRNLEGGGGSACLLPGCPPSETASGCPHSSRRSAPLPQLPSPCLDPSNLSHPCSFTREGLQLHLSMPLIPMLTSCLV